MKETKEELMSRCSPMLRQALLRPENYHELSAQAQWDIDEGLGILDWFPTPEDQKLYKKIKKVLAN